MDNNKDNEISGLDDFFDDDPTGELPVLNLQDIDPELAEQFKNSPTDDTGQHERLDLKESRIPVLEPDAAVGSKQANVSLRQMELEIQALQSNWHEIEDEVRSRDEFIEGLENELRNERSTVAALSTELNTAHEELDKANEECTRLAAENAERNDLAKDQEQRLEDAQAGLLEQQDGADELRKELDQSRQELSGVAEASTELAAQNQQQQNDAEDLSNRLGAAKGELQEQTARADELQESLHEAQSTITELESGSSKLTAEHREHIQIVADQAKQIERLQATSIELRTQSDDLANYVAGRKSDWDALHAELALQSETNSSLQQAVTAKSELLDQQKQENTAFLAAKNQQRDDFEQLATELSAKSDALAESQTSQLELEAQLLARTQSNDDLDAANAQLTEMTAAKRVADEELEEKDREIDQLNETLKRLEAEHAESTAALKKQREIIQHMENEVRSKLEAITVIGRNAQRNRGKPASVHRLEVIRTDKSTVRHKRSTSPSERMMIALKGERKKEYRIAQGTMTIGRGKENDIRLRHHYISRHHAQIMTDADGSIIEDLGSKNGVLVNAEPVSRCRLNDGDVVDIGEMQFQFIDPLAPSDGHKTH